MNYLTHQLLNAEELKLLKEELNNPTLPWENGKNSWNSSFFGEKQLAIK